MKTKRTFGVELEFNTNGQGGYGFVQTVLQKAGHNTWAQHVHHDGSEVEVSGPVLKGESGKDELQDVMACLHAAGCMTNRSDGLHVHLGTPEFVGDNYSKEKLVPIVQSWYNNQELIVRMVAPRRKNSYVCYNWTPAKINNVTSQGKYQNLNVSNLYNQQPAIELRLHEGTLEWATAEPWVEFGHAFFEAAIAADAPIKKYDYAPDFLAAIELDDAYAKPLIERVDEYVAWEAKRDTELKRTIVCTTSDFSGGARKKTGQSGRFE